jgi:hypothetical protein
MPNIEDNSDSNSFSGVKSSSLLNNISFNKLDSPSDLDFEKNDSNSSKSINNNLDNSEDNSDSNNNSDEDKKKYNSRRVREFLIRLAKACIRHEIRTHARNDFNNHTDKIKKSMLSGKPHDNPDNEIEELKKKVEYLINVEKNPKNPETHKLTQERILLLEGKLNRILQSKLEREKRFEELEKKLNLKHKNTKQYVHELEKKLLLLERKLIEHQLNKKSSKSDIYKDALAQIKTQINKTKETLNKIKD